MSGLALEPVDTDAPDLHLDFHVSATGPIRHRLYSSDEVQVDVGAVSMYLNLTALDRLLAELGEAKEQLDLISRYPDPLPPLE